MKSIATIVLLVASNAALWAGGPKGGEAKESEGIDAAKLWVQTCTRCHNARPAKSFSDSQWDVIVHHMRVRASLTGEEARVIAQFLKEAN